MVTVERRLCDSLAKGPFRKHIAWVGDVGKA